MKILGYELKKITNRITPPIETKVGEFTIVTTPTAIVPADMTEYVSAWNAARSRYNQERSKIYDMYQNAIDFDTTLQNVIEIRLLATAGKKIQYTINDKQVDQANVVISSPRFNTFIHDLLLVNFWGMGVFQFKPKKWHDQFLFDYFKVPIKHIDPYRMRVMTYQNTDSNTDIEFESLPDVVFVGEKDCGGILSVIVLDALRKRHIINGWSGYAQLASTNFKQVKYRSGNTPDPKTRQEIRDKIRNVGNGVLDYTDGDFDLVESNQTSSQQNQLFENFVAYCDEQITKAVLGQTMTTEDGSSRSQAEVHERTQQTIFDADSKMVLDWLNYEFYEVQNMFGIPSGGRWSFVESDSEKAKIEIEKDLRLKELGYIFEQSQIAEKYGLTNNTKP